MDEDLKIVLTSELEADEQASARRISAQLPNIAKLINSKSNIKVGVTLDESTIQAQTQRLTQQIARVTKTQGIGVTLSLDQGSMDKIRAELDNLKVNPDISRTMTDQLDQMGIQIDKIGGRWEAINGKQERMLSLTIQGTDQMGRTVTYLQTYDAETGNINTHLTNVTANLEKQRITQEQLAKQAKKDNESRVLYLNQQRNLVDELHSKFTDPNASKPITYQQDLEQVNTKYGEIIETITALGNEQGKVSAQEKTELESKIASYKILATEIRNAEYVATNLRARTTEDVNAEQRQKLSEYENKLRSSGKLTETFQERIAELQAHLETAFDSKSLTDFLNQFDRLKSEVGSFDSQISAINAGFKKLSDAKSAVFATKGKMLSVSPDSAEYKGLEQQLANQVRYQKEISAEIGKQVAKNPMLLQYAKQYQEYLYASANAAAELAIKEGRVRDVVQSIDASMQPLPAVIQNIEARFSNLKNAPDELTQKVRSLHVLMEAVSNADSDSKKITAYDTLKEAISGCNKEITQLTGVQNSELRLFRNTEGIEKAKADLATIGLQWSALKRDPGLNAQFKQLGENLKLVERGEMDLRAWTTQFGRFKSEVKAAGKNMMSLTDTLKNNLDKVTQWASATTILFAALRKFKDAVSIVKNLDTAMIDLKKTTDATEASYRNFYLSANEAAKLLGVTTEEIISQTAEWSRLGYTMAEAAKMAENSAIFTAISPELDTQKATDGLISIMKAFEYDADEVLDGVISKINRLGNELAVSNRDIVEVMTRASASMKEANNTFDQTAALAVAAVEITRDSAQAGELLPDAVVIQHIKVAISVKGRRRLRPSKDFVVYFSVPVGSWYRFFLVLGVIQIQKKQVTFRCEVCGKITIQKEYDYNKNEHHYCSTMCKSIAQTKQVEFECEICGKKATQKASVYNRARHHYCSPECSAEGNHRLNSEVRKCELCGKNFTTSKSDPKRFCSVKCQHEWQKTRVGRLSAKYKREERACDWCGKLFDLRTYKIGQQEHYFCSKRCRQDWYAKVLSQSETVKTRSRDRAIKMLQDGDFTHTNTKPQNVVNNILHEIGLEFVNEYRIDKYSIDNYLPEHSLSIEVMGDYWHCSPIRYKSIINNVQKQIIERDRIKSLVIHNITAHRVLYLWESDIMKKPTICEALIRMYVRFCGDIENYNSFNYDMDSNGKLVCCVVATPFQEMDQEDVKRYYKEIA